MRNTDIYKKILEHQNEMNVLIEALEQRPDGFTYSVTVTTSESIETVNFTNVLLLYLFINDNYKKNDRLFEIKTNNYNFKITEKQRGNHIIVNKI